MSWERSKKDEVYFRLRDLAFGLGSVSGWVGFVVVRVDLRGFDSINDFMYSDRVLVCLEPSYEVGGTAPAAPFPFGRGRGRPVAAAAGAGLSATGAASSAGGGCLTG